MNKHQAMGLALVRWYLKAKRDLPWRHTRDPYKIWISEIMLQQTRVDTAIPYYLRFIKGFPDPAALAEAKEEEVLSLWKGLGYYSRAKNLHKAAQVIQREHESVFPKHYEEILALPGIGVYTAGAISSIAYDQAVPAVDGNVLRVISRIEALEADIGVESTKKLVGDLVLQMMPENRAADFNQALMELGAMICVPLNPLCAQCPLQHFCNANLTERQQLFPIKAKKKKPSDIIEYDVAVVVKNHSVLMEFREHETLLGRMWGLPMVEKSINSLSQAQLYEKYGFMVGAGEKIGTAKHVFTHRIWKMDVYYYVFPVEEQSLATDHRLSAKSQFSTLKWIEPSEMHQLPIPTAFQKVLKLYDAVVNRPNKVNP